MKPTITFECLNEKCAEHGKQIEIKNYSLLGRDTDEARDEWSIARFGRCRKCYSEGKLTIEHGGKSFLHIDALGEHLAGLAREAKLLRKLVDHDLADEQERARYEEAVTGIADTQCPCCGKPLSQILNAT